MSGLPGLSHIQFNPCCCISLKNGTTVMGIFDIIYGVIYAFRFFYLEYLQNSLFEFFPDNIPNPTDTETMTFMFKRGNYMVMIGQGISLLIAVNYLKNRFNWLNIFIWLWMILRVFLIISLIIFCNALMNSEQTHFRRYGFEVLISIFLSVYFLVVLLMFIHESRIELSTTRAIKPININEAEHEGYLLRDKDTMFDNATNFHVLSPVHFLESKFVSEKQLTTEPSLLQYVAMKTKVPVMDENKVRREMARRSTKRLTLKSVGLLTMKRHTTITLPEEPEPEPEPEIPYEPSLETIEESVTSIDETITISPSSPPTTTDTEDTVVHEKRDSADLIKKKQSVRIAPPPVPIRKSKEKKVIPPPPKRRKSSVSGITGFRSLHVNKDDLSAKLANVNLGGMGAGKDAKKQGQKQAPKPGGAQPKK